VINAILTENNQQALRWISFFPLFICHGLKENSHPDVLITQPQRRTDGNFKKDVP
jgi:hypothetical protein